MVSLAWHLAIVAIFTSHNTAVAIGECHNPRNSTSLPLSSSNLASSTNAALGYCSPTTATVYKTATPTPVTYIFTKTVGNYSTIADFRTTTTLAALTTMTQEVNTTITVTSTIKIHQYFTITDMVTGATRKRDPTSPVTILATPSPSTPISSMSAAQASCYPFTATVYQTAAPPSVTFYITDTLNIYNTIASFDMQTASTATVVITKQDTVTSTKTRTITIQAFVTVTETIIGAAMASTDVGQCSRNPDCPFGPGFVSSTTT